MQSLKFQKKSRTITYRHAGELHFGHLEACILFITKISRYTSMQPLSYCQYGCYSHIYKTYVHTFVLIVSLEKWSLTFKIIPGIPPRLVLILLVLVCRIQCNDHKVVVIDISSTSHQSDICRSIYAVPPKNYENKYTTTQCTKLDCWHFGLSTLWSVDVLACRRFALSTFWFVNILVCRRFGLSMFQRVDFRFVDILPAVDVSVCRCSEWLPKKGST